MCREEGVNLQRGMNYHLKGGMSVILMSLRPGAPYADRIEDDGNTLIYEGHDVTNKNGSPNSKTVNQPEFNPSGSRTQNGLFHEAGQLYRLGKREAELVKAYEKLRPGIWVYNGIFKLVDSWRELSNARGVFKFRFEAVQKASEAKIGRMRNVEHNRLISTSVKLTVWKRDKGRCVICGSQDNLHFDHIIPYSKGGSSLVAENIQILCMRHNIEKRDRIK